MTEQERQEFINRMEEIGDHWEDEEVKSVYGNMSLDDAINDRMGSMNIFGNILGTVLNYEPPKQQ